MKLPRIITQDRKKHNLKAIGTGERLPFTSTDIRNAINLLREASKPCNRIKNEGYGRNT